MTRTRIVTSGDAADLGPELRALLEAGECVALPTETVYGLAARADVPAGLEALRAIKRAEGRSSFTWHVAEASAVRAFPQLVRLTARLVERYWPGPLTLVLEGTPSGLEAIAQDGWTGIRQPASEITRALIAEAGGPVVMTSANLSGQPPLVEADAVQAAFEGEIRLVVDGGKSTLEESSTVLRLGRGRFEILREGLITESELRAAAGLSIVFVCTGNTCRSPMAEAMARRIVAERLGVADGEEERFGFRIASCGVFAGSGSPASSQALEAMAEVKIDLSRHRSRAMIPERIADADQVYCLTESHLEALRMSLPPGRAKHAELIDPAGADIADPIGGSLADYRACAARIRECLEERSISWI